jgi:hypothetical protein
MSRYNRLRIIVVCIFLIAIIASSFIALQTLYFTDAKTGSMSIPLVGIAFAGNSSAEAKVQIDRTKNYTNLFVLAAGRSALSRNQTAVMEICDYAVANGLKVILNLGISDPHENDSVTWFWSQPLDEVKRNWTARWGDKFLGIYVNDEPGGIQLDGDWKAWYARFGERLIEWNHSAMVPLNQIYLKMLAAHNEGTLPQDYSLEADFFVRDVLLEGDPGLAALNAADITTFTSDYGLYWFDYLGGYDVLFAQLGWNVSVPQQIALIKGAARLQDKQWGTILTWKYQAPPFLGTGSEIYSQMLTSYQAGADYIVIFDYSTDFEGNSAHAMLDEHYIALEQLWTDIHNKQFIDLSKPEAALILPQNYGWGMRNPHDTIWGFWGPDAKTNQIATIMSYLIVKYGASLDIIYEDPTYLHTKANYKNIYFWNSTFT